MAAKCEVNVDRDEGVLIVALCGHLNSANAEDVDHEVMGLALLEDQALVLDLAKLSYINSAGLRIILRVAKQSDWRGRAFVICAPNDTVLDVMEISGLTQLIKVFDTRVEALEHMRAV